MASQCKAVTYAYMFVYCALYGYIERKAYSQKPFFFQTFKIYAERSLPNNEGSTIFTHICAHGTYLHPEITVAASSAEQRCLGKVRGDATSLRLRPQVQKTEGGVVPGFDHEGSVYS